MFARNIIRNFVNFNAHCVRTQPINFSTSFDQDNVISNHKYLSSSFASFNTYSFNEPVNIKQRQMKYIYESQENEYLSLLDQNLYKKDVEIDYSKMIEIIDDDIFILQPDRCISKEEIRKVIEVLETISNEKIKEV